MTGGVLRVAQDDRGVLRVAQDDKADSKKDRFPFPHK